MRDNGNFTNMNQTDAMYHVPTNPTSDDVGAQRAAPLRENHVGNLKSVVLSIVTRKGERYEFADGVEVPSSPAGRGFRGGVSWLTSNRIQRYLYLTLFLFVMLLLLAPVASAQDAVQPTPVIMEDEVNAIAKDLFCPVCENIPLDTCGTAACADWRYEIRLQLEDGKTRQEIVDDFVVRFGDRVVGTPQNPTLRALSLITPWVLVLIGLGVAGWTFINWRRNHYRTEAVSEPVNTVPAAKDDYRAMLEKDLAG